MFKITKTKNDSSYIDFKDSKINEIDNTIYNSFIPGLPIRYDYDKKQFAIYKSSHSAFVGCFLRYERSSNFIYVLYKGLLNNDPITIPFSIKPLFILAYLKEIFKKYKDLIKTLMPREKKLKRLSLQMITREDALILNRSFDDFLDSYNECLGNAFACSMRESILATPIYINDNGIIKLYHFKDNELTIPDIEAEGNFLAFFIFQNK